MIIEYSVMCGVKESSVFHQNSMSNSVAIMGTESPGGIRGGCKSLYIKDSRGGVGGILVRVLFLLLFGQILETSVLGNPI